MIKHSGWRAFGIVSLLATLSIRGSEETVAGRLWVRLQNEQGQSVAARVYLRDEAGKSHIPDGSIGRGRKDRFFHAAGQFQITLRPAVYTVEVVKGFEYQPVTRSIDLNYIELGDRSTVETIVLKRFIDMPARGWFSGDVHMHPNHREGGLYMTMEDCQLLAAGEDIRVANLLISNRQFTTRVFDTEYFLDGAPDPASGESLMVVQEEFRNTSGMYGHMPLLGINRLVEPFFTGERPYWEDYPANYTIAKRAREMGGVVTYAHPADRPGVPVGAHLGREFPIDLALGVIDGLDVLSNKNEDGAMWMYYRVLNSGLRCTASAGTDTQMDVTTSDSISGGQKVYVKLDPPLTYPKWIASYKAGRTFVSNGPLLTLEVEGSGPGDEIRFAGAKRVKVSATARSLVPMQTLELVVNGEVVAKAGAAADGASAELTHTLDLEQSAWIAARVGGPAHRRVMNDPKVFAHTSPVYCVRDGKPVTIAKDATAVIEWIDRLIEDVKSSPRFATAARRQEVLEIFQNGRRYYERVAAGK